MLNSNRILTENEKQEILIYKIRRKIIRQYGINAVDKIDELSKNDNDFLRMVSYVLDESKLDQELTFV